MQIIDEAKPKTEESSAPRVLVAAPSGLGGVSSTVDRIMPYLPEAERVPASSIAAALPRVLRGRYDVLHVHPSLRWRAGMRDSLLAAASGARGRRLVVQWHGWDTRIEALPSWASPLRGGLHLTLTDIQRKALLGWGIGLERIFSTVSPYDPGALPSAPRSSGRPPTAVYLGRFVEEKGIDLLIGAVGASPELRCVIAGAGPAMASISAAILRHRCADRVSVRPWLDQAARRSLWEEASVLVLPSEGESYPLSVVEALAAGVPVVATAMGAVPALIEGAGVIVERSIDAVAAGIHEVLASPPPRLLSVQAEIQRSHHPSEVAKGWSAVYRHAVE